MIQGEQLKIAKGKIKIQKKIEDVQLKKKTPDKCTDKDE